MKTSTTAIMVTGASSAAAMIPPFFNTSSTEGGVFRCPMPFGLFCAGDSMSQNLLMQCEMGMAVPINCIEHTASAPPFDDYNARCFESQPMAGDAACAKNDTVYPLSGNPFPLPPGTPDASLPDEPSLTATPGSGPTSFAIPMNLTQWPMPTPPMEGPPPMDGPPPSQSAPPNKSPLPTASLAPYVTTVTVGTQTNFHTVTTNCGNGTMIFGSTTRSYAAWQTGSIPGELGPGADQHPTEPLSHPHPTVVPNTIPCAEASSETSTVSWAESMPTATTAQISFVHPSAYASAPPSRTFSGYRNSTGSSTQSVHPYPSSTANFDSGDESAAVLAAREPSGLLVLGAMIVGVLALTG